VIIYFPFLDTSHFAKISYHVPKSLTQLLAQAKNGDQQFWKPKIHAANEACTQGALILFSLTFWGGGGVGWGGGVFSFFLCSQHVSFKFPMCSPRVFPIAPRLNPLCFAQSPLPFTYIGGPKGEVLHLSIESSILGGGSIVSISFCYGPIKITRSKKKRLDLWGTPK
jgi:hypothetical protein